MTQMRQIGAAVPHPLRIRSDYSSRRKNFVSGISLVFKFIVFVLRDALVIVVVHGNVALNGSTASF